MNKILDKLKSLNTEWSICNSRIEEIKEDIKPLIIERFKQLNYKEEEVEIKVKVAPRKFEKKKIIRGFVSWDEDFEDRDTKDIITIERYEVVMEDGEWYTGVFSLEELINWEV